MDQSTGKDNNTYVTGDKSEIAGNKISQQLTGQ